MEFARRKNNPSLDLPLQENFLHDWKERLCYEGTLVYGGTGSGKTSGTGRELALSMLRSNFGGLVLSAKNDEPQRWIELCKEAGRENDIILFSHENDTAFNFIDYSKKTQVGMDLISNCAITINTFIKNVSGGGGRFNEAFWQSQQDKMIENLIKLLYFSGKRISIPYLHTLIREIDKRRGETADEDADEEGTPTPKDKRSPLLTKLLQKIKQNHPEKFEAVSGYVDEICRLSPTTYSCVVASVTGALHPLTTELLESKMTDKTNVTPDDILFRRKIVIINFDVKRFQTQGRIVNLIWKEALQNQSEATAGNPNRNPAFLWMDEGQNFITKNDQVFMPTARSARVATVFLTQNLPNIRSEFENQNRADAYRGIFQTVIFHQNPCPVTNAYMEVQILPPPQVRGKCLRRRIYDLKTGGPPHYEVEALVFHKGTILNPTGERYLKFSYRQLQVVDSKTQPPPDPTVWLITTKKSVGAEDFRTALASANPIAQPKIQEIRFATFNFFHKVDPNGLTKVLQALDPKPRDIVCLVRGGGYVEQFVPFQTEEALRELRYLQEKGVIIVTGLGHACDQFDCDDIADHAEITPSAAGFRVGKLLEKSWVVKEPQPAPTPPPAIEDDGDGLYENNDIPETVEEEEPSPTLSEALGKIEIIEGGNSEWAKRRKEEQEIDLLQKEKLRLLLPDLEKYAHDWKKILEEHCTSREETITPLQEAKNLPEETLNKICSSVARSWRENALRKWALGKEQTLNVEIQHSDWEQRFKQVLVQINEVSKNHCTELRWKLRREAQIYDQARRSIETAQNPEAEKSTSIEENPEAYKTFVFERLWASIYSEPILKHIKDELRFRNAIHILTVNPTHPLEAGLPTERTSYEECKTLLEKKIETPLGWELPDRSEVRQRIKANFERITSPTLNAIRMRGAICGRIGSYGEIKVKPDPRLREIRTGNSAPVKTLKAALAKLIKDPPEPIRFINWFNHDEMPALRTWHNDRPSGEKFEALHAMVIEINQAVQNDQWEKLPGERVLNDVTGTPSLLRLVDNLTGTNLWETYLDTEYARCLIEEHAHIILDPTNPEWAKIKAGISASLIGVPNQLTKPWGTKPSEEQILLPISSDPEEDALWDVPIPEDAEADPEILKPIRLEAIEILPEELPDEREETIGNIDLLGNDEPSVLGAGWDTLGDDEKETPIERIAPSSEDETQMNLRPVQFPQEKAIYEENVLALLKKEDAFPYEELLSRMQKDIRAWWVTNKTGKIVGWCSAGNSPYITGAVHLYGVCIWPEHQGKGLGTKTLLARIALFPNKTITTSIQKGSEVSLHLAQKLGFKFLNTTGPWDNYVLYQE